MAATAPWEPVAEPYSVDAATTINRWIDTHLYAKTQSPSANARDNILMKRLVKGTLIWAYCYGNSFDANNFLLLFSGKDESFQLLPLHNGGLLFMLNSGCLKISRDRSSPEDRIFPEDDKPLYPRNRWYATIFNTSTEITFYFSAVGPCQGTF